MTFPREGKFTSSHFFASKDVMGNCHSPRNVYKLIPLPVFFVYFFGNFYGNLLRPPIFL